MEVKFSSEVPVKLGKARNGFMLSYNVVETPMEEIIRQWQSQRGGMDGEDAGEPDAEFVRSHKYMYHEVRVANGQWNYGGIVNAIVRDKYDVSSMESLNNNITATVYGFFMELVGGGLVQAIQYLKDSFKDLVNTEDFKSMQDWRAMAKKEAKSVLKMV